jgi:hypothetical protein
MTPRARRALAASSLGLSLASVSQAAADSPSYEVSRTATPAQALLAADETAWKAATPIEWGRAPYATRFRALWNDDGLFLRFDADDEAPWHTMTKRDQHIWEEEVVEIFVDLDRSGHDYYELEISPANVVCDLRMISPWPDKKGDIDWSLAGLETRVHKRAGAEAAGWTATAFLPWRGLGKLPSAAHVAVPPKTGDKWRFNVFRIKRPGGPQNPAKDAVFAAWSPTSDQSFHDASAFRDLVFAAPRP